MIDYENPEKNGEKKAPELHELPEADQALVIAYTKTIHPPGYETDITITTIR